MLWATVRPSTLVDGVIAVTTHSSTVIVAVVEAVTAG